MEIKRYKIGLCEIELRLPLKIDDTFPFSLFLTDEVSDGRYIYTYGFTDKITPSGNKPIFNFDNRIIFDEDGKNVVYYKKKDGSFFARRTDFKDKKGGTVEYLNEYSSLLWDKSVLDTVGFEKMAYDMQMLIMHASFINVNGSAILFTAPRQTGKSTQARLWNEYAGAEIINGDKALLFVKDGEIYASSLPYCGSSYICKNAVLPVRSIVKLGRGENKIEPLSEFSAVREILNGCYLPFGAENVLSVAEYAAGKIPMYRFDCKPDFTAVKALESVLW